MLKKNILAMLVIAALLCTMMAFSVPAEAADGNVAKIGETEYATLAEAVTAAAEGDTIVLLKAVVVGNGETLTIDKKVTITTTVTDAFTVNAGGTLNLKQVTINSTSSILWANGGIINIDGAVLTQTGSTYCAAFAENNGQINLKSGTIEAKDSTSTAVSVKGATLTVEGGKILHNTNSAISARNNAVVNIKGGEIKTTAEEAYCATFAGSGAQLNITGGEISAANGYGVVAIADGKVTISGGTVKGVRAHENANASVTISGGTINGKVTVANDATVTVTGGSFEQDVTEFCAAAARIGNTYYPTLAAAVAAAAEGDTIVLLKAVVVGNGETLTIDKKVTITTTVTDAFTVNAGGTLNLKQVTINSTSSILWANGGIINIDGAVLTATGSSYVIAFAEKEGQINLKSGTIESKNSKAVTIDATGENTTVTISGGKVLHNSSSAIAARNNAVVKINGGEVKTTAETSFCAAFATNGAEIIVSGGEISAANDYGVIAAADGKVAVSGGTVKGVRAHENANAIVTISGGTINGKVTVANDATVTVTGGSFEQDVTEFCAAEHHVIKGEDGRYVCGPHAFSTKWTTDEENHWHECDCGAIADQAEHTYENGICTGCEKKDSIDETGDTVLVSAAVIMMLSAAAVVLLSKKRLMT